MELDPCLSPCTQINFKYIKDLNTGLKPLKLLKEKVEEALQDRSSGRTFGAGPHSSWNEVNSHQTRARVIKKLLYSKGKGSQVQSTGQEEVFPAIHLTED